MRAILKERMANYISLESLIKYVDFGKKCELPVFFFFFPQKKIAKMTINF